MNDRRSEDAENHARRVRIAKATIAKVRAEIDADRSLCGKGALSAQAWKTIESILVDLDGKSTFEDVKTILGSLLNEFKWED